MSTMRPERAGDAQSLGLTDANQAQTLAPAWVLRSDTCNGATLGTEVVALAPEASAPPGSL